MKILCVEDGSVDLDKLETEGLKDGGVLVYKQGAEKPFVLEVDQTPSEKELRTEIYKKLLDAGRIVTTYGSVEGYRNFEINENLLKKIVLGE